MKTISNCRACESDKLTTILDLGEQYTSDFRDDDSKPPKYPLVSVICEDCMLVQLKHTTPSEEMYHENYGFKSGVSDSIKNDLKDIVFYAQSFKEPRSWLDIASNDGTLLSFVPSRCFKVGVDPITKYCEEAVQHGLIYNDFYSSKIWDTAHGTVPKPKFDVITSVSCFYDMDDPNTFVADVNEVLAEDGVWVIQQNYLLTTMQLNAVDNFCHEHLEYYTLLSLENLLSRHELEVIDLKVTMVNGGSIRTVVAKKGQYPIQDSVEQQRTIELDYGLHELSTYKAFSNGVLEQLDELKELVTDLYVKGNKIFILAASTRGATIWQSAGIGNRLIDCAVERNPEKVGKYFSAIGVPIISEEEARELKPDYMIIGPWFFAEEIIDREKEYLEAGGKLIVPLPKIEIVEC
jgi:NDP-4-keto-2,6-dideoxyhexose 3-C-methyltransferase